MSIEMKNYVGENDDIEILETKGMFNIFECEAGSGCQSLWQ